MAEYRQVHCSFWHDSFVVGLTPEEKYFFLYLMTNQKTTQCGAYELPVRVMCFETGYNEDTIRKLIERFENTLRIRYDYDTQEVFLVNWLRYNWINSPKVIPAVQKSAESLKSNKLRKEFNDVCIRYGYRMDRLAVEGEGEGEGEVKTISSGQQADADTAGKKNRSGKSDLPESFIRFWKTWPSTPRRTAKEKCADIWRKRKLHEEADQIIAHVTAMKGTKQWRDGYEPAPKTYLNERRWHDGLPMEVQGDWAKGAI